jgi:hypothetical protein
MATRKKADEQPPDERLATEDERSVFAAASLALNEAIFASTWEEMRHVAPALQYALAVIEAMKARHFDATHAQAKQLAHTHLQSLMGLTHRMIVWDEQHMGQVPPEERASVEAEIEQRREWVRQAMLMHQAME